MGRKTTRRPRRNETSGRPSNFFLIALGIGLILFFVMVAMLLLNPPKMTQGRAVPRVAAATALSV